MNSRRSASGQISDPLFCDEQSQGMLRPIVLIAMGLILTGFTLISRGAASDREEAGATAGDRFSELVRPVFRSHCLTCHGGGDEVFGDVNLSEITTVELLKKQPDLLSELIDAIDSGFMPPDEAKPLSPKRQGQVVAELEQLLSSALSDRRAVPRAPIRRMNRFQYNNAVQDLFRLNVEVFALPERMMREHGSYFRPETGKMPASVVVGSRPLGKSQLIERRLGGVTAFPQDLRAEHGFDNQGDHLSLSPLLLESFLKLGLSIVESPDFNSNTCGIWEEFFEEPPEFDFKSSRNVIRERLGPFLTHAFRRPVEPEQLDRYTSHVVGLLESGRSFTDSMKSAAAAALASPAFFYLREQSDEAGDALLETLGAYDLASRLSFFLWGSLPDQPLLDVAASGRLRDPEVLMEQVSRMLKDRRVKRFCDSFPAQWLQLDRIISSTPDPQKYPQFYFLKYRASMHMMMEPLLVFETILIENRSVLQLIDCDFSYRSELLESWYRDGTQGAAGPPTKVTLRRVPLTDRREGGVITNAAVMTMTSNATRTQPITRGAWIASVILNDPPEPPPANVPPLADEAEEHEKELTLRERFELHRKRPDCAGCHRRIDPLGFALENFDAVGIWRDQYENGRPVDASGELFGRHSFTDITQFKDALLAEKDRFTLAFAAHLLAFSLGREVGVEDSPALDHIVEMTAADDYRIRTLIREIVLSEPFRR
jgi:hypothetical protein